MKKQIKNPEVKIYTTPTCHWCMLTKEFFKEHKVKYQEIDVSKDQKLVEEMVKKSGQYGTPVIDIDGKITVGFDEEALRKGLKIK
ncbi:glutaredoxin family protein [Candidatus Pacearchaeota archaeon]|nr:glutaredoxin family protein [Candidatus Pacearchaeota archaeon]